MADEPELQKAFEDLQKAVIESRAETDKVLESKASTSSVDALVDEKLKRLDTVIEEKSALLETETTERKAMATRLDELETALERTGHGETDPKAMIELRAATCKHIIIDGFQQGRPIDLHPDDVDQADIDAYELYCKHFSTYIRKGHDSFLQKMGGAKLETKLMSVDRDPGGGYWVKPQMSSRISTIIFETSPIRPFAAVENITTDALEMIADLNQAAFGWVGEHETRAETDTPDIGLRIIPAHEQYAEPRVTQKLVDDAGFDVEAWLSRKVAARFARAEATAFVTGTGVAQPRGFTTYPNGTADKQIEQIASGTDAAVTADGIKDLVYSIKSPYLRNARFMMARLTIRDVRKLKDGQGRYLWEPNLKIGEPQSLEGYPLHQADDMAAVASASLSIVFGDFNTAYTIVDRMGTRVLRDPFTAKPNIKLYTTRRVGGDVVNFEAIKLQILSV